MAKMIKIQCIIGSTNLSCSKLSITTRTIETRQLTYWMDARSITRLNGNRPQLWQAKGKFGRAIKKKRQVDIFLEESKAIKKRRHIDIFLASTGISCDIIGRSEWLAGSGRWDVRKMGSFLIASCVMSPSIWVLVSHPLFEEMKGKRVVLRKHCLGVMSPSVRGPDWLTVCLSLCVVTYIYETDWKSDF